MKKKTAVTLAVCTIFAVAALCVFRGREADDGAEEPWDLIPMVMVHGTLYLDTGYTNDAVREDGLPDGKITASVDGSERPTKDDESNFGSGFPYQFGSTEGTIEIFLNGKWHIFATEDARKRIQFPAR